MSKPQLGEQFRQPLRALHKCAFISAKSLSLKSAAAAAASEGHLLPLIVIFRVAVVAVASRQLQSARERIGRGSVLALE